MRRIQIAIVVTAVCFCFSDFAPAQTLLDQLEQRLTQDDRSEGLPAPQRDRGVAPIRGAGGYPSLGVTVEPVTDAAVLRLNLRVRSGALITTIVEGSPAARAGLPLGGVIVAFGGERIDGPRDLVTAVRAAPTNRPVEISYYDGPRLFRKRIQLLPGDSPPAVTTPPSPPLRAEPPPTPGQPPAALEHALGEQGRRPILGQVGRFLDSLVAPAGSEVPFNVPSDVRVAPAVPPAEPNEVAELRQQVALLQQQLAALQQKMARLEARLEASPMPPTVRADGNAREEDDSPFE